MPIKLVWGEQYPSQTKYHVYFDEGGLLGHPRVVVSEELLSAPDIDTSDVDIRYYYVGHMTSGGLLQMCMSFNVAYPRTPVIHIKDIKGRIVHTVDMKGE